MGDTDNEVQTPSAADEPQSSAAPVTEPEPQQPAQVDGDGGEIKPATTYEL